MQATEGNSRKWLWLTLLVTAAIVLTVQIPLLLDAEYVDEDMRFFYWLHRLSDSSLFEGDPLLGYQIGEVTIGTATLLFNKTVLLYGVLYSLLGQFLTPFIFSKLLMLPLALIASFYLFRLAERLTDAFSAFLLSVVFTLIVVIPFSDITYASGLPRAFTLPLLLAALYYMTRESTPGMAVVLVLSMVYPPAYLTILLTYGVKYGLASVRQRRLALTGKQMAVFAIAFALTLALLSPALLTGLNQVPVDGEGWQSSTVYASPLYGEDGRYPLLNWTLNGNGGVFDFGPIGLYSMLLLLGLFPTWLVLGRRFRWLPAPYWCLALGSLAGFVLSWLAILFTPSASLHMPSRYMQGTVFIISLLLFASNAPLALHVAAKWLADSRAKLPWLVVVLGLGGFVIVLLSEAGAVLAAVLGLLALLAAGLVVTGRRRARSGSAGEEEPALRSEDGPETDPGPTRFQTVLVFSLLALPLLFMLQLPDRMHRLEPDSAALVRFAKTLPEDALLAGYPCLVDDVPLYAQRPVLFSCEVESRDMALMLAALNAYFAEDEADVLGFCREYGVDYLVASPWTFTEDYQDQERVIFEPLDSFIKQQLAGRSEFVLDRIPETEMVFRNDSLFVVPCSGEAFAGGRAVGELDLGG